MSHTITPFIAKAKRYNFPNYIIFPFAIASYGNKLPLALRGLKVKRLKEKILSDFNYKNHLNS